MRQPFTSFFGRYHAMQHPDIDQLQGADRGKDAPFSGEAERVIPDRVYQSPRAGGAAPAPTALRRTPIAPEILTKIKHEVLYEEYLAASDTHHRYAAVLAYPAFSVREFDIPVHRDDVGSGKIKNVPDTNVLNIESDSRELLEKTLEPIFDSALSLESAAFRYVPRVDEHPVIPPGRHELWQVMTVQSIESVSQRFLGDKCSDHWILLSGLDSRLPAFPDPGKSALTARYRPTPRSAPKPAAGAPRKDNRAALGRVDYRRKSIKPFRFKRDSRSVRPGCQAVKT